MAPDETVQLVRSLAALAAGLLVVVAGLLIIGPAGGSPARTGDLIAFTDGNGNLYVIRVGGTGLRRLIRAPGVTAGNHDWSPDGSSLVFDSTYKSRKKGPFGDVLYGPHYLSLLKLGESRARKLVKVPGEEDLEAAYPAWSPDGRLIAFSVSSPVKGFAAGGIYLVDTGGENLRKIPGTSKGDNSPTWSLDGKSIAFVQLGHGIEAINVNGENRRKLSNGSDDSDPAWSPDGRKLAFSRPDKHDNRNIWVMNADGSGQRQLTGVSARTNSGPGGGVLLSNAMEPAWSPTGRRIAFAVFPSEPGQLWIMNSDGSHERPLPRNIQMGGFLQPSWQP